MFQGIGTRGRHLECIRDGKRESPKAGTLRLRGKGLPKQLLSALYCTRNLHASVKRAHTP